MSLAGCKFLGSRDYFEGLVHVTGGNESCNPICAGAKFPVLEISLSGSLKPKLVTLNKLRVKTFKLNVIPQGTDRVGLRVNKSNSTLSL